MSPTFPSQDDDIGNKKSRRRRMIVTSLSVATASTSAFSPLLSPLATVPRPRLYGRTGDE